LGQHKFRRSVSVRAEPKDAADELHLGREGGRVIRSPRPRHWRRRVLARRVAPSVDGAGQIHPAREAQASQSAGWPPVAKLGCRLCNGTSEIKKKADSLLICFGKGEKGWPKVRSSSSQAQLSGPPAQHTVRSRYCTAIDRWRVPHKVAAASFKISS
jgi:hypothetical protein